MAIVRLLYYYTIASRVKYRVIVSRISWHITIASITIYLVIGYSLYIKRCPC